MSQSTPEIEAILKKLTDLCCEALTADKQLDQPRVDELTEALSTNGWKRHRDGQPPLSAELEQRVRSHCQEPAMHRGAQLKSLVEQVQQSYDNASRYSASAPKENKDVSRQAYSARG